MAPSSYESLYRRLALAAPALLGVLLAFVGGLAAIFGFVDGAETRALFVLGAAVAILLAVIAIALAAVRVHRWTIEAHGIRIEERPRVPGFGRRQTATVAFADVAAVQRLSSSIDRQIEITTREGRHHRLGPRLGLPGPRGIAWPDLDSLEAFAAELNAAAERSGRPLPAATEAPGFWSRPAGLGFLAAIFIVTLPVAIFILWSLFTGQYRASAPNANQAVALLILLPVGSAFLFIQSLRRRRKTLAKRA